MIDTQTLKASIDIVQVIERDLGPGKPSGRWTFWKCPFHSDGNSPSLGATSDDGRWHCFGCNQHGDAIDWMRQYHNLSFRDACLELSLGHLPSLQATTHPKPYTPVIPVTENSVYQQRAIDFIEDTHSILLNKDQGGKYLLTRGITLDTIQRWQIGYNPQSIHDPVSKWGLDDKRYPKGVWLPKGWVIPCKENGIVHSIKIRRPDADIEYGIQHNWANSPKYINVAGGSTKALFGTDLLPAEVPTLLIVEGEFNAMIAYQELHSRLDIVSVGSASNGIPAQWIPKLSQYQTILALFDADDAGDHGMGRLIHQLPTIQPIWLPKDTGDLNDYYLLGGNLNGWLTYHLNRICREQHSTVPKHLDTQSACKEENPVYLA